MKISATEMEIMRIIWDKNDKVTTSELAEKMPDKKLTTISTLAGRLIDKGCLKSEKIGRSHVHEYEAIISEQEYQAKSLMQKQSLMPEQKFINPSIRHLTLMLNI